MASWGAAGGRVESGIDDTPVVDVGRSGTRSPPLPAEAAEFPRRPLSLYAGGALLVLSAVVFMAGVVGLALDLWVSYSLLPSGPHRPIRPDDVSWLLACWLAMFGLIAVLYTVFAVAAAAGIGSARFVILAMTSVFTLLDLFVYGLFLLETTYSYNPGMFDVGDVVRIFIVPMVLALIGTLLLFTPRANRFIAWFGTGEVLGGTRL